VLDGDCVRSCGRARPALADGVFAPGNVAPMTQVAVIDELMSQIQDA
jgi:hypothetical protein